MNILWITADQMQGDTLSPHAQVVLPHLRQLMNEGMHFTRAYTPMPVCCPVRAMWMTGAYPWHNGVFTQVHSTPALTRDMREDCVTYTARLKDKGYKQGLVGKWHASNSQSPCDFGFDEIAPPFICVSREMLARSQIAAVPPVSDERRAVYSPVKKMSWPGSEAFDMWGHYEGPADLLTSSLTASSAVELIKRYSSENRPWHIAVHFTEPHDPYTPHKKYVDMYDKNEIRLPGNVGDTFEGKPGMHKRESATWGELSDDEIREGLMYYYAYCTEVDHHIGIIMEALKASGQERETLVIFTSDHGDMAGAHRMWIKSWMPYEEAWRVPLIVKLPGVVEAGAQCDRLVQTHWIPHTLLDMAAAEALPYKDGQSMKPFLIGDKRIREAMDEDALLGVSYGCEFYVTQRLLITNKFKYIFNGFDFDEMYDLEQDKHEMRNVIDDPCYKIEVEDLQYKLYELMNKFRDPYGDNSPYSESYSDIPNRYGAPRYLPRGRKKQ